MYFAVRSTLNNNQLRKLIFIFFFDCCFLLYLLWIYNNLYQWKTYSRKNSPLIDDRRRPFIGINTSPSRLSILVLFCIYICITELKTIIHHRLLRWHQRSCTNNGYIGIAELTTFFFLLMCLLFWNTA